ncbi:MAG: MSCRAMM family protein [Thermoanaerobaculia bacterium]
MAPHLRTLIVLLWVFSAAVSAHGAIVQGKVTSASGNERLSGKIVAAYDTTGALRGIASTDDAGTYILTLPNGGYRLLAYDPAGEYATAFHGGADSFETTPVVQVADGAPVQADFALARGGIISGSIASASAPLAGAVVEAYNLSGTRRGFAAANAAGEYSIVLPPGDFKLFAYDANGVFAGEFHSNVRAFADATPLHVTAPGSTTMHFILDRAASVTGAVLDADTNTGIASMLVYAYTAAGSLVTQTATDGNGAFRFSLGPGLYRFVAGDPSRTYGPMFYPGGRSFEGSGIVALTAGQQLSNLELLAERGGQVRGRVPPALLVIAYNLDGTQHAAAAADAAGEYLLVVAPGAYKLAVVDPSGGYATQFYPGTSDFGAASELTILAGQSLTGIDFNPSRAGRFTGTVRDAISTRTLAGMTIAAYDAGGASIAQTNSVSNGTYTLAVTPGQYRLAVFDSALQFATAYAGGATSYEATIPLSIAAEATSVVDFAMRRGVRVTGIVQDASGTAIAGVEIFALDLEGNRVAGATAHAGAFAMMLVPGTYRFVAIDPWHRYLTEQWAGGATVSIGSQSPVPLAFSLDAVRRRRTVRQ